MSAHAKLPHTLVAREHYAWPGGYELFAVMNDGEVLCFGCVRENYRQIAFATRQKHDHSGWSCEGFDHTGNTDEIECCAHCSREIGGQS